MGLVICKPLGSEAMSGHRSLRAFAEMAAATGVPALRFDYLRTGDSLNIDPDADQIEAWCRDVVTAVDELRRRTGVTHIVDGADHTFSRSSSRAVLEKILSDELFAR